MDGVTILKTYDEVVAYSWGWSWPGFIVALAVLAVLVVSIYYAIKEESFGNLTVGIVALLFGGIISFVLFAEGTAIKQPHYDVYIHGTINMDEFNEKYRIVEQDGLIYTITENTSN